MKYYEFTVNLGAEGETEEDAWEAATEAMSMDPGVPSTTREFDSLDAYLDADPDNDPLAILRSKLTEARESAEHAANVFAESGGVARQAKLERARGVADGIARAIEALTA